MTRLDEAVEEDIGQLGQSVIECRRSGSSMQRINRDMVHAERIGGRVDPTPTPAPPNLHSSPPL